MVGNDREAAGKEEVSDQYSVAVSVEGVQGRLTTPPLGAVDDIVVDEGSEVEELHGSGEMVEAVFQGAFETPAHTGPATHPDEAPGIAPGREQEKRRPEHLPAPACEVLQSFVEAATAASRLLCDYLSNSIQIRLNRREGRPEVFAPEGVLSS